MKNVEPVGLNTDATRLPVVLNLSEEVMNQSGVVEGNMHAKHAKNQRDENLASMPRRNRTLMMRSATT